MLIVRESPLIRPLCASNITILDRRLNLSIVEKTRPQGFTLPSIVFRIFFLILPPLFGCSTAQESKLPARVPLPEGFIEGLFTKRRFTLEGYPRASALDGIA